MLKKYLEDIFNTSKTGDATEESYYPDLKRLIENWSQQNNKKLFITPLPKRTEAGNPDFRIWDGRQHIVGYIEAKDPKHNLERFTQREKEQIKRYRETFPNLIITNFFDFYLYRNGELIDKVSIGSPFVIHELKMAPPVENEEKFLKLLEKFFAFSTPKTTTAKTLAIELAKRTRFLRDNVIAEELKEHEIPGTQTLEAFYKAFKDHLISNLNPQEFADLFAQTITYGLFAARSRAENEFNRELAHKYIPPTIGILRDLFRFISSTDLPKSMEWIIDDIAEVLAVADVKKMITDFYKKRKGKDPIIHFYETFLAEYDPKEREKRGVYYTPEPVVKYIVNSIDVILKEKFNKKDGFADHSVTVLDPAAGTLTFPVEAIHKTIYEYKKKYGEGNINGLIRDHILKNFYAFELMMAPYAMGHLKIGFILDEFDYKLSEDERFNLYLTNTLDFTKEDPDKIPGIIEQTIAKESSNALKVKEQIPIMVIMGNPPYSGISENKGEWILKQIEEYKQIEGKLLDERNPKWIQDDYVKFFRFAQWKIEQNDVGVLGFITNHAWLDNPTFRGMRYSLLKTFDEIYILNLHGSTLKKERTPEGGKDENVFDIQPGVAITLGIKNNQLKDKKIFYADLWGLREEKYDWLENHSIKSTKWQELLPADPYYFFVPKEEKGFELYKTFYKITDIFPINSVGIVTARDEFVIDFERQSLETRIRIFRDSAEDDEFIKQAYKLKDKPTFRWYIKEAREKLRLVQDWENCFTKILYRPFDERWIYYHSSVIERARENVMKHMLRPNMLLSLTKRHPAEDLYNDIFVSDKLTEGHLLSGALGITYTFPLYLYNNEKQQTDLFSDNNPPEKRMPNIDKSLFKTLQNSFNQNITPEEIFYYIYAVLYSNIYRQKYQEFLKIDFPRIPFIKNYSIFKKLVELGKILVELHLLKSPLLNNPIAKFFGKGDSRIKKREYKETEQRVYINDSQYFENVKPEVWNYYIGGYQVLDKWLKDRKNRALSAEEVKIYCRIITALSETIKIQKKIDLFYLEIENNL